MLPKTLNDSSSLGINSTFVNKAFNSKLSTTNALYFEPSCTDDDDYDDDDDDDNDDDDDVDGGGDGDDELSLGWRPLHVGKRAQRNNCL